MGATYLVTATVQVLVDAEDAWDARLTVKEAVDFHFKSGPYGSDPANGCVVSEVLELPEIDEPPQRGCLASECFRLKPGGDANDLRDYEAYDILSLEKF
jgi:hypothetical protein